MASLTPRARCTAPFSYAAPECRRTLKMGAMGGSDITRDFCCGAALRRTWVSRRNPTSTNADINADVNADINADNADSNGSNADNAGRRGSRGNSVGAGTVTAVTPGAVTPGQLRKLRLGSLLVVSLRVEAGSKLQTTVPNCC